MVLARRGRASTPDDASGVVRGRHGIRRKYGARVSFLHRAQPHGTALS